MVGKRRKKALHKDFWQEIRKSRARFISIFCIVALGVAFFSGIQAASPDMRLSGDAYYNEASLMDLKVMATLGLTEDDVKAIQGYLYSVKVIDEIYYYMADLCEATRQEPVVELGVSPRGTSALAQMAKARAVLKERDYVIPEDVQAVFEDVCCHRLVLRPQAKIEGITAADILKKVLDSIKAPSLGRR